jgi:GTP cyclohydrolase FolE2
VLTVTTFRRRAPAFSDLFTATSGRVLAAMDAADDDVPGQAPAHALALDSVGMRRRDVIYSVRSPFDPHDTVAVVCEVSLETSLPADKRGIHVSRLGDVLARSTVDVYEDLSACARHLADRIAECQYGGAVVHLDARMPYLEMVPSDHASKVSLESLRQQVCVRRSLNQTRVDAALQITHIVACPCVQQTYKHALQAAGGGGAASPSGPGGPPLMTHSQRCETTIRVCDLRGPFPIAAVLEALDAVLVRTSNTLPRDVELSTVYRAHRTPQFIEDALREAVVAVAALWPTDGAYTQIEGEARSLESIHEFDLTARLRLPGQPAGREASAVVGSSDRRSNDLPD